MLHLFLAKFKNAVLYALILWGLYSKDKGLRTEDTGYIILKDPLNV
jgi:hypothetical protein